MMDVDRDSELDSLRQEVKELQDLRAQLNLQQAENIEMELELTHLREENEDLRSDFAREKRLHAKTDSDRKKAFTKYNNLLDEMRMSPDELEKELAFYKRRADDLEDSLQDQRSMWQKTNNLLTKENEEYQRNNDSLRDEMEGIIKKYEDERKRVKRLEDELESSRDAREEMEKKFKDQELEMAQMQNKQAGLDLRIADMHQKTSKYKRDIKRMSSKKNIDDDYTTEDVMKLMQETMEDDYDDRSGYDDRRDNFYEDEYKRPSYSPKYGGETRGRDRSRSPDWNDSGNR